MRKTLFTIALFIVLTLVFLQYGYKPLSERLGLKSKAGIWVESNKSAQVLINGKLMGETPFKNVDDLKEGQYQIELKDASSSADWKSDIKLNGGTLTVVNRDLDTDSAKEAGEVITLEKGSGATITSVPSGAKVLVDGEERGITPLFLPSISSTDHLFLFSKENYIKRTVRATVTEGFGINIAVDLAGQEAEALPSSPPIQTAQKLKVLQTPTGFLRVRSTPSTAGTEVARVSPGDELTLEEETNSAWDKVKTSDNKEGYVSSQYVQKIAQ
jgi:membrane protein implicated in regulation of membrane protease activity